RAADPAVCVDGQTGEFQAGFLDHRLKCLDVLRRDVREVTKVREAHELQARTEIELGDASDQTREAVLAPVVLVRQAVEGRAQPYVGLLMRCVHVESFLNVGRATEPEAAWSSAETAADP